MDGFKIPRLLRHVFLLFLLGVLLAGCHSTLWGIIMPGSGSGSGPGVGTDPGVGTGPGAGTGAGTGPGGQPAVVDIVDAEFDDTREPLTGGSGATVPVQGRIVFGDTGLPLRSTLSFATDSTETGEDGFFAAPIPLGRTDFLIDNLLGPARGTFVHGGAGEKLLRYPVFDEFEATQFNKLLTDGTRSRTTRWPVGAHIPVWIKTGRSSTTAGRRTAREAFLEWQSELHDTIVFMLDAPPDEAAERGIVVEFVPESQVPDPDRGIPKGSIGYCTISYDPERRIILRGTVVIAQEWQRTIALHRHEIGHCIGLTHSDDIEDVMWPFLDNSVKELSNREIRMARLLYLIPAGSRPLPTDTRELAMSVPRHTTLNDDGTVTVVFPSFGISATTVE